MKKIVVMIVIIVLVFMLVLVVGQGGFIGLFIIIIIQVGGFIGLSGVVIIVVNVKLLCDDIWVILCGKIVECIFDDLYKFQDVFGVINVDIDYKCWNGVIVGLQDIVEIQGEVDKDWNLVEIDVKQICKIVL